MAATGSVVIKSIEVKDMRWPSSLGAHGSDAIHRDPDYSCVYVIIDTSSQLKGFGLTLGRCTEIVQLAVKCLEYLIVGKSTDEIYTDFGKFWREITSEIQMRWIGPENGVMHLAVAAIINALWDLFAKIEGKPMSKLLTVMEPEPPHNVVYMPPMHNDVYRQNASMLDDNDGDNTKMTSSRNSDFDSYLEAGLLRHEAINNMNDGIPSAEESRYDDGINALQHLSLRTIIKNTVKTRAEKFWPFRHLKDDDSRRSYGSDGISISTTTNDNNSKDYQNGIASKTCNDKVNNNNNSVNGKRPMSTRKEVVSWKTTEWECSHCTFMNTDLDSQICSVCSKTADRNNMNTSPG